MHGTSIDTIRINGGRLCLDFINTAAYEASRPAIEFVTGFDDLVRWGLRQELIRPETAQRLRERARLAPSECTSATAQALELRQALRDIFEPNRVSAKVLAGIATLNHILARDAPAAQLVTSKTGAEYAGTAGPIAWLTGPVAISAAELATSKAAAQVQMCPGEGCHWLFIDQSRNGTRRWCSMESCGNRAKARAHYRARRQAPP